MRFIVAPLFMIAGFLLMRYPVQVAQITGPIGFAEKYFRSMGGTYGWWRFVGFGVLVLGLLWITGVFTYNPNTTFQTPGVPMQ